MEECQQDLMRKDVSVKTLRENQEWPRFRPDLKTLLFTLKE